VKLHKGIYILPSILTLGNMFCGFYVVWSIINQSENRFINGPLLILVALFLDGLDGRIARLTNSESSFGAQLDSLADFISFGIAPSFLAYSWGVHYFGRLGLGGCFLLVAAGAMRLARFNIQDTDDHAYFSGLPIPAQAGFIAVMIYELPQAQGRTIRATAMIAIIYILSLLMVSRFKYRSFKDINLREKKPFRLFVFFIFMFFLFALKPSLFLIAALSLYILSGPFRFFLPMDEGLMVPSRYKRIDDLETSQNGTDDDIL